MLTCALPFRPWVLSCFLQPWPANWPPCASRWQCWWRRKRCWRSRLDGCRKEFRTCVGRCARTAATATHPLRRPVRSAGDGDAACTRGWAGGRRGQPGHRGLTRHQVAPCQVDTHVEHWPDRCRHCDALQLRQAVGVPARRQLHDLPAPPPLLCHILCAGVLVSQLLIYSLGERQEPQHHHGFRCGHKSNFGVCCHFVHGRHHEIGVGLNVLQGEIHPRL